MAIKDFFRFNKQADVVPNVDDVLLQAILGSDAVDVSKVMNIPAIAQALPEMLISSSPEETYIPQEELHNAINKLPEKQRRRFILYYLNGLTFEEIATAENISHPMVVQSVQRALANLNQLIGDVEL